MPVRRVLLVGGGRRHLEVLRCFAERPDPGIELTLASPNARSAYSPMLPGVVAGHRSVAASQVDLAALARWAHARFIRERATGLDLYARIVHFAHGSVVPFDLVSLDIGSAPDPAVSGVHQYTLPLHPTDHFLAGWARLEDDAAAGNVRTVAVVGGSSTAVEILLAMHYRLARTAGERSPRFALITNAPHVLHDHIPAVRQRLGEILIARGVVLYTGATVTAAEPGGVMTAAGRSIAADRVVWVTPTAGAPWIAASSLACDAHGFVRVSASLQSASDPFVFAVGDCAMRDDAIPPDRRASALMHAQVLDANLRHAAHREPLVHARARSRGLFVITTGRREAVASWGPMMSESERIWRWRDRVDRAALARYQPPIPKAAAAAPAQ